MLIRIESGTFPLNLLIISEFGNGFQTDVDLVIELG